MLATTIVLTAAIGAPEIAPDAKPVLERMYAYYKSIPGASVKMTAKMPFPGAPDQVVNYAAIKPNQFEMVTDLSMMDLGVLDVRSNGTNVWTISEKNKIYSEQPAPAGFDKMDEIVQGGFAGPFDMFFSLLAPNPSATFTKGMKTVASGGTKTIDDVTYDMLTITPGSDGDMMLPEGLTIDMVVGRGKTPWVHSAVMNFVDPSGQAPPMSVTFKMSDWKVLKASEKQFAFTPKADDKKVDDVLQELFANGPGMEEPNFDEMKGQPAPDFSLKDLDGNTVTLASLKGKTVILDFFATWCGPCKMGVPVLMDIAKARADDGVVLYVIDLDEPIDKIKDFLTKKKWDVNVLLTGGTKVATEYKVGGIPHTVVIAPDGNIQFVEVGFMGKEHTEKAINEAIDAAIGKKKVASTR
ncbi:MAG: redoxin domain-containing protein [Phycisphaerales bacterium]|nr:redoxin domain-containing protein [Phycisphaerales bacterium]